MLGMDSGSMGWPKPPMWLKHSLKHLVATWLWAAEKSNGLRRVGQRTVKFSRFFFPPKCWNGSRGFKPDRRNQLVQGLIRAGDIRWFPIQKLRTTSSFAGRDTVGQQKSARIFFPCFEFEIHAEVLKGWILEDFKNPSDKASYERGVFLEDGGTLRDSTVPKLGEQECVNNPFPLNISGVSNVSAYVCVTFSDVYPPWNKHRPWK